MWKGHYANFALIEFSELPLKHDPQKFAKKVPRIQGSNAGGHIYTVKADGTGLRRLTAVSWGSDGEPDWSPDGSKILFEEYSATEQQADVWVMGADGGGKKNLTRSPSSESSPAWSPGGEQIVFASSQGGDYGIWKMGADGSAKTPLTSNDFHDYSPDW